ncbi:MAG: hypothetical protein Q8Q65_03465 [bacterium]|nr:hypothetical protein [bacterium]
MCEILNNAKWLAKQQGIPKAEVKCAFVGACDPAANECWMLVDPTEAEAANAATANLAAFYDRLEATVQIQAAR